MMASNEPAQRIAQALQAKFDIGIRTPNWRDDPLDWEESTVEQIAAVIADALKPAAMADPAPLAGTWSREKPTIAIQRWWYKASAEDEPEIMTTYRNESGQLFGVDESDWPKEIEELNGLWSGPLAAPEFVQGKE